MNLPTLPKHIVRETKSRHLLIWCLITIYYFIFYGTNGPLLLKSLSAVVSILNIALSYYVLLLYIYPKILEERNVYYVFHLISVFLFFFIVCYFQLNMVIPVYAGGHVSFYNIVCKASVAFLSPLFASVVTYYHWSGIKRIEEEVTSDKERAEKEFLFMKGQFHSHVMFNFLQFCYTKIKKISPVTAHSVEDFSSMLGYSLIAPADTPVSLKQEVQYIKNFITFHKNLTNDLHISFTCEGDMENIVILPRILIVFIENAVKHGIVHDPLNPITIQIKTVDDKLIFSTRNKINHGLKMQKSGIGLRHVGQILHFFYPGGHVLTVSRTEEAFFCQLQLYNLKKLIT